jgi:hypothetical protein
LTSRDSGAGGGVPSTRVAKVNLLPTFQPPFGHFVLETM